MGGGGGKKNDIQKVSTIKRHTHTLHGGEGRETCGHGEQSRYDTQGEVLIDLKGLCLLHDVSNLALNAGQKRCGFGEDVLLIGKN